MRQKNNFNFSKLSLIVISTILILLLSVFTLVACGKDKNKKQESTDTKKEIVLPQTQHDNSNDNMITNGDFYNQVGKELKAEGWDTRVDNKYFSGLISLDENFFNENKSTFHNLKNPGRYTNSKNDRVMLISNIENADTNSYGSFYSKDEISLGKNIAYKINFVYYFSAEDSQTNAFAKIQIGEYSYKLKLETKNSWAIGSLYVNTTELSSIKTITVSLYGKGSIFVDSISQEKIAYDDFKAIDDSLKYDFSNSDSNFDKFKTEDNKRKTTPTEYGKNSNFKNFDSKLNKDSSKMAYGIYSLLEADKQNDYYISKILDGDFNSISTNLLANNEIESNSLKNVFSIHSSSKLEGTKYKAGSIFVPVNNTVFITPNKTVKFSVYVKTNNKDALVKKSPLAAYAVKYSVNEKSKKINEADITYSDEILNNNEWQKVNITIKNKNTDFPLAVVLLFNLQVSDNQDFTYMLFSNFKIEEVDSDPSAKELNIPNASELTGAVEINSANDKTDYKESALAVENTIISKKDVNFGKDTINVNSIELVKNSKVFLIGDTTFEIKQDEYALISIWIDSSKIENGEFEFKLVNKSASSELNKFSDDKKAKISLLSVNKNYNDKTSNFVNYVLYVYNESQYTSELTYQITFGKGNRFEADALAKGTVLYTNPKMYKIENKDYSLMPYTRLINQNGSSRNIVQTSTSINKLDIVKLDTSDQKSNLVINGNLIKINTELTSNINGSSFTDSQATISQPNDWEFSKLNYFKDFNSNFEGVEVKENVGDLNDTWEVKVNSQIENKKAIQLINDNNAFITNSSLDDNGKKAVRKLLNNKKVVAFVKNGDYITLKSDKLIDLNSASTYQILIKTVSLVNAEISIDDYSEKATIKKQTDLANLKVVENKILLNTIVTNPKQLNFKIETKEDGLLFIESIKVLKLTDTNLFDSAVNSDTLLKLETLSNTKSGLNKIAATDGIDNDSIIKSIIVTPQDKSDLNRPIYYQSKKINLKAHSNYQLIFYYKGAKPSVSILDVSNEKNKVVLPVEIATSSTAETKFNIVKVNIKTGLDAKSIIINLGLGQYLLENKKLPDDQKLNISDTVEYANIMLYEAAYSEELKTVDFSNDNSAISQTPDSNDKNGKVNINWSFKGASGDVHGIFDLTKDNENLTNYNSLSDDVKNQLKALNNPILINNTSNSLSSYQRSTFKITKTQGEYFIVTLKLFTTDISSTKATLSVSGFDDSVALDQFEANKINEIKFVVKLNDKESNIIFNIELAKKGLLVFNDFKIEKINAKQYNEFVSQNVKSLTIDNKTQDIENSKSDSDKEKSESQQTKEERKMIWVYASSIIISLALISIIIILIFKKSLFRKKKNPYKKKNNKKD